MSKRTPLISLFIALGLGSASAQESPQDILRVLLPNRTVTPTNGGGDSGARPDDMSRATMVMLLSREAQTRSFGTTVSKIVLDPRVPSSLEVLQRYPAIEFDAPFELGSDLLTPAAIGKMDLLGQALMDAALLRSQIVVSVYSNAPGSPEYNLKLSELRAQSVVNELATRRGVDRSRIHAVGLGRSSISDTRGPGEVIRVANIGSLAVQRVDGSETQAASARAVEAEVREKKQAQAAKPPRKERTKVARVRRQPAAAVADLGNRRVRAVVRTAAARAVAAPPAPDLGFFSIFNWSSNSRSSSAGGYNQTSAPSTGGMASMGRDAGRAGPSGTSRSAGETGKTPSSNTGSSPSGTPGSGSPNGTGTSSTDSSTGGTDSPTGGSNSPGPGGWN